MSMSVENFLGFITCGSKGCPFFFFFFLVVTKKGRPAGHYITAGQCTLSPPQPKGASFAPVRPSPELCCN